MKRKNMNARLICVCSIIVTIGSFCFADTGDRASGRAAFVAAAKQFTLASETNRYREAERVINAIPTYPQTFETNTGIGTLRGYDYSKPSYILPSKDVRELLGDPSSVTTNSSGVMFAYTVGNVPGGDINWTLHIEFVKDQVVMARMFGENKKH